MDAPRLRPLGIGEILDAAINIYRNRFTTLVKVVAVVVLPVQVVSALVQISIQGGDRDTASVVGAGVALVLVGIIGFVASQLATATSLRVVSNAYMNEHEDWRSSLSFALNRIWSLIGMSILVGFLGGLGLLLCIVPGVYFLVSWAVAIPVLLLENKRAGQSMRRSRELVKGRWWPVLACEFTAFLLSAIVASVLQAVFIGAAFGSSSTTVTILAGVISGTLAASLTTPFTAAVTAVLYFDLRVRKEGFDLELLARTLGQDPPAAPGPVF